MLRLRTKGGRMRFEKQLKYKAYYTCPVYPVWADIRVRIGFVILFRARCGRSTCACAFYCRINRRARGPIIDRAGHDLRDGVLFSLLLYARL